MKLNYFLMLIFISCLLVKIETHKQLFDTLNKRVNRDVVTIEDEDAQQIELVELKSEIKNEEKSKNEENPIRKIAEIQTKEQPHTHVKGAVIGDYSEITKLEGKNQKHKNHYKIEKSITDLPEAFAFRKIHKMKKEQEKILNQVNKDENQIAELTKKVDMLLETNKNLEQELKKHAETHEDVNIQLIQKVEKKEKAIQSSKSMLRKEKEAIQKKIQKDLKHMQMEYMNNLENFKEKVKKIINEKQENDSDVKIQKDNLLFKSPENKLIIGDQVVNVKEISETIKAMNQIINFCNGDITACLQRISTQKLLHDLDDYSKLLEKLKDK